MPTTRENKLLFHFAIQLMRYSLGRISLGYWPTMLGNTRKILDRRYLKTLQSIHDQIQLIEQSTDVEVICVLSRFNDADFSVFPEEKKHDDDVVKVIDLVNRDYRLTKSDWSMKCVVLKEAGDFISQENVRSRVYECEQMNQVDLSAFPKEEEHDDDVATVIEENKALFYRVSELEELLRSLHCRDVDTSSRNDYGADSNLSSLGYEVLVFLCPC
ncbi:unnamed protein product [Eruca vesicaria subsp. sativa]|uniref:Uncharacterized protein n=1 Tax=Eruca vesicaria subsp. sativa TaxID=29727 RepID=A0ABC8K7C9_ERUVS|nr:unnamed protein product [Eruca vesicaria subsp. sativa]